MTLTTTAPTGVTAEPEPRRYSTDQLGHSDFGVWDDVGERHVMTSGSRDDCDDETDRLNAEEDRRRAAELDEQETFPVQVAFALHRDTLVRLLASAPLDHDRDGHLVELTVDQTRAAISARLHRGGTDAAGEWKQGLDTGSDAQVLAWAENHIAAAYPTR